MDRTRVDSSIKDRTRVDGDVDISVPANLLGDPARAKLVMALADGRSLPASMLASEAGVAPSTASEHLAKLRAAGLVDARTQGRHRYYFITDPRVVQAVEVLAQIAPRVPVRSLRQGTRANALRSSRLCYDHLAGRLGVALMRALIDSGAVDGGDGAHHPEAPGNDRLSAPGHDVDYRLTDTGAALLRDFGVDVDTLATSRRPLIRYCMDWTEQAHHLAGGLGAAVTDRMLESGWLRRTTIPRALRLSAEGRSGMARTFGVHFDDERVPAAG